MREHLSTSSFAIVTMKYCIMKVAVFYFSMSFSASFTAATPSLA